MLLETQDLRNFEIKNLTNIKIERKCYQICLKSNLYGFKLSYKGQFQMKTYTFKHTCLVNNRLQNKETPHKNANDHLDKAPYHLDQLLYLKGHLLSNRLQHDLPALGVKWIHYYLMLK